VIGTRRHESRRIDNQLRGRAGARAIPGVHGFSFLSKMDLLVKYGIDDPCMGMIRRACSGLSKAATRYPAFSGAV